MCSFKGKAGAKFAVCNAGGGLAYVGAMQDSFPHAIELSKKDYNAFALIYRPGAQTACKDPARAIGFICEHAEAMQSVGIEIEFHKYAGLSHGFGLGTGTAEEGWLDDAVRFWERQM